jgi:hypothetical protein
MFEGIFQILSIGFAAVGVIYTLVAAAMYNNGIKQLSLLDKERDLELEEL